MDRKRKEIIMRLRRIEGQVRGLQRMVEEEASCPEILTQVSAVTAAIKKAGAAILQGYMEECLERSKGERDSRRADPMRDFHKAITSFMSWG